MYGKITFKDLTILIPKAFLTCGVFAFPLIIQFFPLDRESCVFSSGDLFDLKSLLNQYKFLKT